MRSRNRSAIADGFIGEVLSTSVVTRGGGWGGSIAQEHISAYLLNRTSGATMLTIAVGHTLAALRTVLGDVAEVSAVLATRRTTAVAADTGGRGRYRRSRPIPVVAADTGATLAVSAPDRVLVSGALVVGAPVSIHYRGGMARDAHGFVWEINGTDGDIRITGAYGHPQLVPLSVSGARGNDTVLQPLDLPAAYHGEFPQDVVPGNVARRYARMARDLRDGTKTARRSTTPSPCTA